VARRTRKVVATEPAPPERSAEQAKEDAALFEHFVKAYGAYGGSDGTPDEDARALLTVVRRRGLSVHKNSDYGGRARTLSAWLARRDRRDEIASKTWAALWGSVLNLWASDADLWWNVPSPPPVKRPRANPTIMARGRVYEALPFVSSEEKMKFLGESMLDLSPRYKAGPGRGHRKKASLPP
jgi:hypothetical protein